MIESIHFRNFKVLRDATLPLGPFTLIVGPNGSGKTTALQGFEAARDCRRYEFFQLVPAGGIDAKECVRVTISWSTPGPDITSTLLWLHDQPGTIGHSGFPSNQRGRAITDSLKRRLAQSRVYSLDAAAIALPVQLTPDMELRKDGHFLPGVLDRLRDKHPEHFEALNAEFARWLPEFDRILFHTPGTGMRGLLVRTAIGQHPIPAADVSQGTLLALAMLTLAYLPDPPSVVCLEEPDRGIHPRLLREVRDALYRLSYPQQFGEDREPVQVIATTHSPYMLDLFKERPEEVVIAQKQGQEATFERLCDRTDVNEVLQDAHLGDLWYSGILGGVPSEP